MGMVKMLLAQTYQQNYRSLNPLYLCTLFIIGFLFKRTFLQTAVEKAIKKRKSSKC
jgi:hypothetical protein